MRIAVHAAVLLIAGLAGILAGSLGVFVGTFAIGLIVAFFLSRALSR